jgi:hypothetical protein
VAPRTGSAVIVDSTIALPAARPRRTRPALLATVGALALTTVAAGVFVVRGQPPPPAVGQGLTLSGARIVGEVATPAAASPGPVLLEPEPAPPATGVGALDALDAGHVVRSSP